MGLPLRELKELAGRPEETGPEEAPMVKTFVWPGLWRVTSTLSTPFVELVYRAHVYLPWWLLLELNQRRAAYEARCSTV